MATFGHIKHVSYGVMLIFQPEDGDKEYLLLENHGGFWGFPKGHPESGEEPRDTAVREALEETGIHVERRNLNFSVSYTYEQPVDGTMQAKQVVLFPVLAYSKDVTIPQNEIKSYLWVTYEKAVSLINLPEAAPALQQVESHSFQTL